MFDATSQSLVGRRCRWSVWGVTYTGTIRRVFQDGIVYQPGDWLVDVDGGGTAAVIGQETKLIG